MFTWHGLAQRSRPPTLVTLESTSPLLPNAVRSPSIHPVARPSSSRGSPEAAPWPRVTAEPGLGSAGVTRRGEASEHFFFFLITSLGGAMSSSARGSKFKGTASQILASTEGRRKIS